MKIRSATFLTSAASVKHIPPNDLPEVVFIGRSNVGKSSFLNTLVGTKGLAKVSGTPGKTRQINFFIVNGALRFVDVPGYGYARASQRERQHWRKLLDDYFQSRRSIILIVLLVDARHSLQQSDSRVVEWLTHLRLPLQIVLTKIDKLTRSERASQDRILSRALAASGYQGDTPHFSAFSKEGKQTVLRKIGQALDRYSPG